MTDDQKFLRGFRDDFLKAAKEEDGMNMVLVSPEAGFKLLRMLEEERAKWDFVEEDTLRYSQDWVWLPDKVGTVSGPAKEKYRKIARRELYGDEG